MITTIVCSVVALIVGGSVVYFSTKGNATRTNSISDKSIDADLSEQLRIATEKIKQLESVRTDLSNNSVSDVSNKQIQKLNEQISDLISENAKLKQKKDDIQKSLDEEQKKLKDALKGEISAVSQKEIDSLKKKIKDLEDDKDDLEDDFKEQEKKLRRKFDDDKKKLESDIKKSQADLVVANEKVENLSLDLQNAKEKVATKDESLSFVTSILQAQYTQSDAGADKLYDAIDDIEDYIYNDVQDLVAELFQPNEDRTNYFFKNGLANWAAVSKKYWVKDKIAVAFVGEFSAGKTSIVNKILCQNDKTIQPLPVSTKATTAIPTYITGGSSSKYQFVSPDNVLKQISEETFKKVNKEVLDEVDGVTNLIKYFVMEYRNPNLNNLSILDTPGFNSNDAMDAERTIGVINECDALFWVFDVNNGTVNRSSMKLIKEQLNKPLYVIINKVDSKAPSEVDKVQNLIKKTLSDAGINVVQFIRFHSNPKLQKESDDHLVNLMKIINGISHESSVKDYLPNLDGMFKNLIQIYDDAINESAMEYNTAMNTANSIQDQYKKKAEDIISMCSEAQSYGHYEDKWFRDDVYEFSTSAYHRLQALLEAIPEGQQSLWEYFNGFGDAVDTLNEKFSEKADNKTGYDRLVFAHEQLKKKIELYKKLQKN